MSRLATLKTALLYPAEDGRETVRVLEMIRDEVPIDERGGKD
jgi:hypothetical protein